MVKGLYSVNFGSGTLHMEAAGVLIFENQRILGGDSNYFYTGNYEVKNGVVQGEIEVNLYGRNVSAIFKSLTRFGRRKFHMKFSGKEPRGNYMNLQNYGVEDPKKEVYVELTRMYKLP